MSQFSPRAISVPESFARAVATWKGKSYIETLDEARTNMTGRLMNRQTGQTMANIEQHSRELPFGFRLATTSPSLIAWMLGSQRKAYTVVPKKAKALRWFAKGGRARIPIFARKVYIPAWKFAPVRPVLQDAIDRRKSAMIKLFQAEMLKACADAFPDVQVEWRV